MPTFPEIQIWQCKSPQCDFRFTALKRENFNGHCPKCGATDMEIVAVYHNKPSEHPETFHTIPNLEIVLDNIRSTFNVGAMFRTADGAGVKKLYVCGITPTPEHPKMVKTGLGAEWSVPWSYHTNALTVVKALKKQSYAILALESTENSISLFDLTLPDTTRPLALVVGNEVTGVDPDILA
ncbi:MAG TPA: TrmH family RNA methyltransferase, partial [Longilinea sp.]|nr:TrmH family RNA methyltransferase [Longilinea sp.]